MRRILAILLILISVPLFAQDNDWYVGETITDIRFVGLSSVSEGELRPIVEPYIGEPFTDRDFLELQRRLYALDFFTSIVPEAVRPESGGGVVLRFTVEERPTVDEIRFVGNRRIRTADLLAEILLTQGDMITMAQRRVDEQAIVDLYLERGYPDVEVSSRVEETEEGDETRHAVIFTISEGTQVTVREINFSGNSYASASTLRGQMETKTQSIFNAGVFQDRVLEEDRLRIENYYRERGYVDAEVVDVVQETERDEENERTFLILTVYVEEGNQYTFGGISFEGNTIFTDEELDAQVRLSEGSILNAIRLQDGLTLVQDQYYQNGYIYNDFNVTEERDEELLSISYTMQIQEQPRAHIENIIIRGNDKTADEVILREIPLQVGDVFSIAKIREGVQNLMSLQYFSAVNPEMPYGSVEGLMDLIINVEEAQTANIVFGVSFGGSSDFPVAGQIGWQDSNFRGQGQTFGFQLQASPIEQMVSVNFLERWFADQRWSLGADLTVNRSVQSGVPQDILGPVFSEDDPNAVPDPFQGYYVFSRETVYEGTTYQAGDIFPDEATAGAIAEYDLVTDYEYAGGTVSDIPSEYLMDYVEWSISIGANTGYRFRTSLGTLALSTSLRSSLNYVGYDPQQVRPYNADLRANLDEWQFVNKWGISASLDRRRGIYLAPSSGYLLSQDVAFTGGFLLGDRHFIRTDSRAEGYLTLWDIPVVEWWNWKTVLAAHSGMSFILPTFWVPDRYADLDQPVAGSDLLSTNPMYIGRGWDVRSGAEARWNNWVELRTPIVEQLLWSELFFDAVAVWDEPSQIGNLGISNMLFGFGGGIRFTIPQFPIRLYLAKRFRFNDSGEIEWQEGDLFRFGDTDAPNYAGGLDFVFAIGTDLLF
ncbi:MAG: outer membrane protein assembly factor BamA [Spirochaetota bacterium]